jgi:hypothetical protein
VCVLERRELVGGACVTEEVWPGQRVSRASYVVSMLQPKVVKDLELTRFGYEPVPLDPPFATIGADGRPVFLDQEGPFEEFLLYRLMTMSVGDLLDEWFDDDAIKGAYASTGAPRTNSRASSTGSPSVTGRRSSAS